jgi:hypothetical protein
MAKIARTEADERHLSTGVELDGGRGGDRHGGWVWWVWNEGVREDGEDRAPRLRPLYRVGEIIFADKRHGEILGRQSDGPPRPEMRSLDSSGTRRMTMLRPELVCSRSLHNDRSISCRVGHENSLDSTARYDGRMFWDERTRSDEGPLTCPFGSTSDHCNRVIGWNLLEPSLLSTLLASESVYHDRYRLFSSRDNDSECSVGCSTRHRNSAARLFCSKRIRSQAAVALR